MACRLPLMLLIALGSVAAYHCVDGVNNVIDVVDNSEGDTALSLRNVKIRTYDTKKRPFCSEGRPAIRFPGKLLIASGEIRISEGLKNREYPLKLELSTAKNSFFIGTVCSGGVSQKWLVPNALCKLEMCELFGFENCALLEHIEVLKVSDIPWPVFVDIGALPLPGAFLKGEWKISMDVTQKGITKSSVTLANNGEWVNVEKSTDRDDYWHPLRSIVPGWINRMAYM